MTNQDSHELLVKAIPTTDVSEVASSTITPEENRPTQTRLRLRIPKHYHHEPVISRLISQHGLTVNITAALLGANTQEDGWFDLELRGTNQQIRSALIYIDELDLEVWHDSSSQEDGW